MEDFSSARSRSSEREVWPPLPVEDSPELPRLPIGLTPSTPEPAQRPIIRIRPMEQLLEGAMFHHFQELPPSPPPAPRNGPQLRVWQDPNSQTSTIKCDFFLILFINFYIIVLFQFQMQKKIRINHAANAWCVGEVF